MKVVIIVVIEPNNRESLISLPIIHASYSAHKKHASDKQLKLLTISVDNVVDKCVEDRKDGAFIRE